jgi:hypothetical protein
MLLRCVQLNQTTQNFMGLFDRFKKKEQIIETVERLENFPEMLNAKLLFFDKPKLNPDKILKELKLYYRNVDNPQNDKASLYFFPDIKIELKDATIPAQCTIFVPDETNSKAEISAEAFQQNWHWADANSTAEKCNYEILVSDFMTRTLDYKTRLDLFMNFLVAVIKGTNPQVVYSVSSQKLIDPLHLIKSWDGQDKEILFGIVNVRLFNISNSNTKELLMDTIGLSLIGLPDFQLRFSDLDESDVARLLWNYAYYIFEQGDVIENGNTLLGLEPNSKWRCERQTSLTSPERIVINVERN